jgi:hypothetical protein
MSCPGDKSVTNINSNSNIKPQFYSNAKQYDITYLQSNCRKTSFYPSFTPTITSISVSTSVAGSYSLVYINGSNFLPPCNGSTYVMFGNYKLPITFYSAFSISFVVPLQAASGNYNIVVVNVYNGNFSPQVNTSYPGNPNYSNSVVYILT